MKFNIEQLKNMIKELEQREIERKKRLRISITLDQEVLDEVNRQARSLRYISRNEFITAAIVQFCSEEE